MDNLEIKTAEGTEQVIVLEGTAVVNQNPSVIVITNGTIGAPAQFLEKKEYKEALAHALVNLEEGTIELRLNAKDSNGLLDVIEGSLKIHPIATGLGINAPAKFNNKDLIQSIRQNRVYFVDKMEAGAIITGLRNFKAKIDKRVEVSDDLKGNMTNKLETIVSEIPFASTYKLLIPIFKGQPKKEIVVEVCVDVSTGSIQFYLQSDDLYELVISYREELMEAAMEKLTEFGCSIVNIH